MGFFLYNQIMNCFECSVVRTMGAWEPSQYPVAIPCNVYSPAILCLSYPSSLLLSCFAFSPFSKITTKGAFMRLHTQIHLFSAFQPCFNFKTKTLTFHMTWCHVCWFFVWLIFFNTEGCLQITAFQAWLTQINSLFQVSCRQTFSCDMDQTYTNGAPWAALNAECDLHLLLFLLW